MATTNIVATSLEFAICASNRFRYGAESEAFRQSETTIRDKLLGQYNYVFPVAK